MDYCGYFYQVTEFILNFLTAQKTSRLNSTRLTLSRSSYRSAVNDPRSSFLFDIDAMSDNLQ